MIRKDDVVRIGKFIKPHGVKGELQFTGDVEIVNELPKPFIICDINGILVPFFIESIRQKGAASLLIKLENMDNEKDASELTHREAYYPSHLLEEIPINEDNIPEIIGFTIKDEEGTYLGVITDIDSSTDNILLLVTKDENEWMLPLADELIVEVDVNNKILTMVVPEGLLNL